jgi:hypothetical protein
MVEHHWNETQSFRHCHKQEEEEEALLLISQKLIITRWNVLYIYIMMW